MDALIASLIVVLLFVWTVVSIEEVKTRRKQYKRSKGGVMGTLTFDTYKFSKRLQEAGATEQLADTLTEARKEVLFETQDMIAEALEKGTITTTGVTTSPLDEIRRLKTQVFVLACMAGIALLLSGLSFLKCLGGP